MEWKTVSRTSEHSGIGVEPGGGSHSVAYHDEVLVKAKVTYKCKYCDFEKSVTDNSPGNFKREYYGSKNIYTGRYEI